MAKRTELANPHDTRKTQNREAVIERILLGTEFSRPDIVEQTGLATSTVSGITRELYSSGMIRKSRNADSLGSGRKTDILARVAGFSSVVCVDLTDEDRSISLVDFSMEIIEQIPVRTDPENEKKVAGELARGIDRIRALHPEAVPCAIGLALPHHPYSWRILREELKARLNLPLLLINNVEAMAIHDYHALRIGEIEGPVFYAYVGRGIGSALILDGMLHRGANGWASDLGHIRIREKGSVCRCGRCGCLETEASESYLRHELELIEKKPVNAADRLVSTVIHGLERRDARTQKILEHVAENIAEGLHTVISLLDPQLIIVAGRLTRIPQFSAAIERNLYEKITSQSLFAMERRYTDFEKNSATMGTALYTFLSVFCPSIRPSDIVEL